MRRSFAGSVVKLVGCVAGYLGMCVATVGKDRLEGETSKQRAIYFKGRREVVMPQGHVPTKSCPEEASSLLCMAETARLTDPMRPKVDVNFI